MRRVRRQGERRWITERMHPAVVFAYFVVILVFTMLAIHPVYLTISFIAAFSLSVYLCGWTASFKTLAWQLPLVVLITFINPIFASVGSTELFRIGSKIIYAEELIFGGCMGLMLVSIMLWFMNLTHVMSSDKMMSLFGGKAPTLSFMLSAVMRQIPQFLRRGKEIDRSTKACTATAGQTRVNAFASSVRLTSVLMAWSMEESLEMAQAMKARGWGSTTKRSSYRGYRFRKHDAVNLFLLAGFAIASFASALPELAHFHFYPTMSTISFQVGYLIFGILALMPLLTAGIDRMRWR